MTTVEGKDPLTQNKAPKRAAPKASPNAHFWEFYGEGEKRIVKGNALNGEYPKIAWEDRNTNSFGTDEYGWFLFDELGRKGPDRCRLVSYDYDGPNDAPQP